MSSELFMFENSFFSDPFSPFNDPTIDDHHHHHHHHDDDIFQTIQNNFINETNSFQETSLDDHHHNTSSLKQNLSSLCQTITHSENGSSSVASMEVKSEECNVPFDTNNNYGYTNSFVHQGTTDNAVLKLMQRSYSSNSFDNKPSNFLFQPCFDSLMESPNFHNQVVSSPESSFSSTLLRRVCSTGDLRKVKTTPTRNILPSSPLSIEKSFIEDAANNLKVVRYSAEQRKERIDRYRAKRIQRNFNKTIKYACRKTLADSRPRIRGRFARNDEAGEIPNTAICNRYRHEDEDFWVDGLQEEENDGSVRRAPFLSSFSSRQDQYSMY